MCRPCVRLAFFLTLLSVIPVVRAIDPPNQPSKERPKNEPPKKVDPAKQQPQQSKDADARIERRNSRMKERNREIDRMLNKQKK